MGSNQEIMTADQADQEQQTAPTRRIGLPPEEEAYLWAHYDVRARARIIEAYQPLVFHIFGKLGLRLGEEAVDVISEGTVGLIHAVDNYDRHRGVPFKSYAYLRVKGSMIDYLRSQKIALKGGELREFEFFSGLASEGEDKISLERLEFLFESLKHLSPREAEIIMGIYHDGLSQSELAARFKCTRANVSILHGRALKRLKHLIFDAQRDAVGAGLAWFNPWS
ncbi:sigma-70 family RNA polymerase sigma factor [bacterium]|nr:sigma-70 family RNA polymerase sigma factor [bacterium]